jgi:hypothetical protein
MTIPLTGPDGAGQHSRDQIAADHHHLRTILEALMATAEVAQIVPKLEHLRVELVDHFELEEGEQGLAQAIGEAAPNTLNRLDRLFEEHRAFLSTIDGIIAQANAYLKGPEAELQSKIRSLCARLEAHEVDETELISEAVFTDLGTSE